MKKLSKNQSIHEQRVSNQKNKYSLVISWKEGKEKKFSIHTVGARELDIREKAKKIFYKIVKEKSGMILHNMQKPFEQDIHNMKRKKGLFVESKSWIHNQNINSFEYTYCKI